MEESSEDSNPVVQETAQDNNPVVQGSSQNNTLAVITHILGLFTGFLGPLIILLVTKEEYVKNHARLALNWQFSVLIYLVISFILVLILIGFVAMFLIGILNTIFCIIAAVKAGDKKLWKYPLSISFFKVNA